MKYYTVCIRNNILMYILPRSTEVVSGNVSLPPSTAGLSSFTIRSGTAAKSQEKSSYVQYSMLMLFLY